MSLSRRDVLYLIGGTAVSTVFFSLLKAVPAKALPRPPAALEEQAFRKACARCYQCIDICPAQALSPAGILEGIANVGTPVLDFKKCILCMKCMAICPTGAIRKVPKAEADIGNAVINRQICIQWTNQKKCNACFRACRYEAILLDADENPAVLEAKCTGCGACERRCPTRPKSIVTGYEHVARLAPPPERILVRLPDRMEGHGGELPAFEENVRERIRQLAESFGLAGGDT